MFRCVHILYSIHIPFTPSLFLCSTLFFYYFYYSSKCRNETVAFNSKRNRGLCSYFCIPEGCANLWSHSGIVICSIFSQRTLRRTYFNMTFKYFHFFSVPYFIYIKLNLANVVNKKFKICLPFKYNSLQRNHHSLFLYQLIINTSYEPSVFRIITFF